MSATQELNALGKLPTLIWDGPGSGITPGVKGAVETWLPLLLKMQAHRGRRIRVGTAQSAPANHCREALRRHRMEHLYEVWTTRPVGRNGSGYLVVRYVGPAVTNEVAA